MPGNEKTRQTAATLAWKTAPFARLSRRELYAVLQLRQSVFVVEQNCVYLDLDGLDEGALHMLCMRDHSLLAYQRCLPPGLAYAESSLGRVVVAPAERGAQLGRELVQRGIEHNLAAWPAAGIRINAQAYLEAFYASLGFEAQGDLYMEDGIPHRQMRYHRR